MAQGLKESAESTALRNAAGAIAWAFRNLFNLPETMALVSDAKSDEPSWEWASEPVRTLENRAEVGVEPGESLIHLEAQAAQDPLGVGSTTSRWNLLRIGMRSSPTAPIPASDWSSQVATR